MVGNADRIRPAESARADGLVVGRSRCGQVTRSTSDSPAARLCSGDWASTAARMPHPRSEAWRCPAMGSLVLPKGVVVGRRAQLTVVASILIGAGCGGTAPNGDVETRLEVDRSRAAGGELLGLRAIATNR